MTIRVRATLAISDTPVAEPAPDDLRWLSASPLIQVDNPKLRELAQRLKGRDLLETARRIHRWIAENLEYAGYLRDARGAVYALEKQRGDCTEYMHLFLALARANGIPARGMAGYVVEQDAVLQAGAFHNWAELYADGAWRIADPQRNRFDTGYGQYIATRILGVGGEYFPLDANRFWFVGDGVQVKSETPMRHQSGRQ